MKIVLSGPNNLTSYDKLEIQKYLDAVKDEHQISILAYRSIEKEVFKYFIQNEQYIPKLTIYTFPEFQNLSPNTQKTIQFFNERGAVHRNFYHNENIVTRAFFTESWKYIMDENDAVVTFYDEIKHIEQRKKICIPIDIANKLKKKAFHYELPLHNEQLFLRKPAEKIRLVR